MDYRGVPMSERDRSDLCGVLCGVLDRLELGGGE